MRSFKGGRKTAFFLAIRYDRSSQAGRDDPMLGLMMNTPLLITNIMRHAEQLYSTRPIVSITADNPRHRYTYAEAFARARRAANVLRRLGVREGDRIATLAWSDYRHFEVYYAISCYGAVCHTINPRLFETQIEYIINHAEDRYLFVDSVFVPLLEKLAARLPQVKGYVLLTSRQAMPLTKLPNVSCYEELLAAESDSFEWPLLDENTASSLCYTSGTTGLPKGVLYSHRSNVLHTLSTASPEVIGLRGSDSVMAVVPMFHANAWGIPFSAALVGAKLVLPGPKLGDGASLADLIESEAVNVAFGVPTVWANLLLHLESVNLRLTKLKRVLVGGSACPLAIMQQLEERHGVYTQHAWGMTEMSPVGSANDSIDTTSNLTSQQRDSHRLAQGRAVFGVEMKIVDDDNRELPRNGSAAGLLKVRGPFTCASYFNAPSEAHDADGWFATGDLATISADGLMRITDRAKDVIKSGGEWISSIEVESAATAFPGVAEAAVIAIAHPKWQERPLLVIVAKPHVTIDAQALRAHLATRIAKWWIPDDVQIVEELPHTATGKLDKLTLRRRLENYRWP